MRVTGNVPYLGLFLLFREMTLRRHLSWIGKCLFFGIRENDLGVENRECPFG